MVVTLLNDTWMTPDWVIRLVEQSLDDRICLDPCSNKLQNTRARIHLTEKEDGLTSEWPDCKSTFANWAYSKNVEWLEKINEEAENKKGLIIGLGPSALISNMSTKEIVTADYFFPLGKVKFVASEELKKHRRDEGKVAEPNAPRSEVSLYLWNCLDSELANFKKAFRHFHCYRRER